MIQKMMIRKFRQFNNIEFYMGKYITAISGHNATGKSTILALLGNCAELKVKEGRPILQNQFRTEFSEIIKGSSKFDIQESNIAQIVICDSNDWKTPTGEIKYRTTWQDEKTRFRIIPDRINELGKKSAAKISWPTLYLGLSRLYPVGEINKISNQKKALKEDDEDIEWFLSSYKSILSLSQENIQEINMAKLDEVQAKKYVGTNTDTYDYLCNSAGQSNLSQILLSLLSFKKLKRSMGKNWNGGLLLIDELDASLHPSAQNKLFKVLYDFAKENGIQIVFTTHSTTLLENIAKRTQFNKENECNDIHLIYLTNGNGVLQVKNNAKIEYIENDLNLNSSASIDAFKKVTIYSEDNEARIFIKKILNPYLHLLNIPEIKIGWEELVTLIEKDMFRFFQTIFIFDGDVKKGDIKNIKTGMTLPGGDSPEKVIWEYITKEMTIEEFDELEPYNVNKQIIEENGPFSSNYSGLTPDRKKYKKWFNDNYGWLDMVVNIWIDKHSKEVEEFVKQFIDIYNNVRPMNKSKIKYQE